MRNAKAIRCKISRGGFSDERVFHLCIDGAGYSGVASRVHMWKADQSPLEEGEPPIDMVIDGLVAARILEMRGTEKAFVSVPDGGVLEVPVEQLLERPTGVTQNVPVGS